MIETIEKEKIKEVFKDARVVALAGITHSGKTNNLVYLLKDLKVKRPEVNVYAYGMPQKTMNYLKGLGVKEISGLRHMIGKKNSVFVLDECQKLNLTDRRYKRELAEIVDFIHHNNNYLIVSSPNIREFNTIIGGVVDKWLLKSILLDKCVNGSQLKKVVDEYKGKYKSLKSIMLPKNELLVINDKEEVVISCEYVKEADDKIDNEKLF